MTIGDNLLDNQGSADGFIAKYNYEGKVEWATCVGNYELEIFNSVAETTDGDYIVGGEFWSDSIEVGQYVLKMRQEWGHIMMYY